MSNQSIASLVVANTYFSLKNGKLDLPQHIKQIKIDVGLCAEAINSALWLSQSDDRFVIGIEPLSYHWTVLQNFDTAYTPREYPDVKFLQLEKNSVELNHECHVPINNRFLGIRAAIDDIKGIGTQDFYELRYEDTISGASSLLRPSPRHPRSEDVKDVVKVKTISLESILDLVDWDRFPYIEHVKTDCEGYDPIVVQSLGRHLHKVVFISCETLNNLWEKEPDRTSLKRLMNQNHFIEFAKKHGESKFVNSKLHPAVLKNNLSCDTMGT
jgi:hypothetical protein